MLADIEQLSNDVTRLTDALRCLGRRLVSIGTELQNGGEPPGDEFIAEQGRLLQQYREIQDRVSSAAASLGIDLPTMGEQVARLADVTDLMSRVVEVETRLASLDETRRRSLAILDRVLSLANAGGRMFGPLVECQQSALRLRHQFETVDSGTAPEEAARLAAGEAPFIDLLDLIENRSDLTDDEFGRKERSVSVEFGDPLRLAILRGRVVPITASSWDQDNAGKSKSDPYVTTAQTPSILPLSDPGGASSELLSESSTAKLSGQRGIQRSELQHLPSLADPSADPRCEYLTIPAERPQLRPVSIPPIDSTLAEDQSDLTAIVRGGEYFPQTAESISTDENEAFAGEAPAHRGEPVQAAAEYDPVVPEADRVLDFDEENDEALIDRLELDGHGPLGPPMATPSRELRANPIEVAAEVAEQVKAPDTARVVHHNTPVRDLAELALQAPPESRPQAIQDVVSGLIRDDRISLAYHLARCTEAIAPDLRERVSPELVRAVVFGCHVRHEIGELASVLTEDFMAIVNDTPGTSNPSWIYAVHLLRTASALRPSLLAPRTNASRVLSSLHLPGMDALFTCCQAVARFGDRLVPLDINALMRAKDEAGWEELVATFRREVSRWTEQARHRNLAFAGATKVLQRWLDPGGVIQRLLDPILRDDRLSLDKISEEVERLSTEAEVRREVDSADRLTNGRRPRGRPIVATSYNQLKERVHEAILLARRWIDLHTSRPDHIPAHQQHQADQLRREFVDRHALVLEELASFAGGNDRVIATAAAAACHRAVEGVWQIFDREAEIRVDEPSPRHLLHGELLLAPGLALDEHWQPTEVDSRALANSILEVLVMPSRTWRDAFEDHRTARDHEATARIIGYLQTLTPDYARLATELAEARLGHLKECRDALRRDCDCVRTDLENATSLGLIREEERARHDATITSIEAALVEVERFATEHARLKEITNALYHKRQTAVEEARERLDRSEISVDHPDRARIDEVLERGDVFTANEYIQSLLDGQALASYQDRPDRFSQFFPDAFRQLEQTLAKRPERSELDLIPRIRNGESMSGLSMSEVPGAQRQQSAKMLESWFTAKRQRRINTEQVRTILDTIGFRMQKAEVRTFGQRIRIEVSTEPLRDRDLCPIDAFGSLANGHYRVLCDWGRSTEEDLLNELNDSARDVAYIVFYFGRLSEARRRSLARLCHDPKRRRKLIVVDDILLIHLCGERGSRLPVFFDCTLPFTFAMPYTTSASLVSPEMFYGRSREIEDIVDPMGTCFIYGGRQLGKTALLRHVERAFHRLEEGRIAFWIDLKERGIGYAFGSEHIRVALADELKRYMILSPSVPPNTGLDRILDHLRGWIEGNPQRRLLVLLDEADNFLEQDAKDKFVHTDRLRGLMVATNRRFKVVFAGLHNVQRTTRQANQPLAHFGEARSIGPLLNGRDARDARDLIERPLRSLGYRFATDDLVTRVLAQTNYYPSLIQLYCNTLLKYLSEQHDGFDQRTSPPYVITSRHLQDVYQDKELRKSIRDKLSLTLRLDPRYEVIAYTIANGFQDDRTRAMTQGFPVSWIREEALYWYRDGFHDAAEDSFRVLLDEMIGLGVLREVEPEYFTLRSPNVASLLGTESEVVSVLTRDRTPPPVYEPATFRSAFRNDRVSDPSRRSPLTADQMSTLQRRENGVSLILGSIAAGLDEIAPFLRLEFPDEYFIVVEQSGKADFGRQLSELDSRAREGVVFILVGSANDWDASWIAMALGKTGRLTSTDSFVRVAFVADPPKIWRLTGWESTQPSPGDSRGPTMLELKPWHDAALAHWLADCDFSVNDEQRFEITRVTGNWSLLLREFHNHAKDDTIHWERHLKTLDQRLGDLAVASNLLDALGIEDPRDRAVLKTLQDLQGPGATGVTIEELVEYVDGIREDGIRRLLRWADLLQLVRPVGTGVWRIDTLVGRLLGTAGV